MSASLTLRFSTQAQMDIRRITQELSNMQRQIASGDKSNDLRGFGGQASRLISAQGLKAADFAEGGKAFAQREAIIDGVRQRAVAGLKMDMK